MQHGLAEFAQWLVLPSSSTQCLHMQKGWHSSGFYSKRHMVCFTCLIDFCLQTLQEGGLAAALQSSGATQPKQQHATAGPNPFSRQQHSQPSAPDIATRLPHTAVASSSRGRAGTASAKQQSSRAGRKPLLKRLLRALMITGASAGLLAAGAWAGTAAYRHYMAQLDDRDQLARRVAELKKQEEKLVLR